MLHILAGSVVLVCGVVVHHHTTHLATYERAILNQIELSVVSDSCICRACETNIKRNILSENYNPQWASTNQETTIK